jgi:hypothetical protein
MKSSRVPTEDPESANAGTTSNERKWNEKTRSNEPDDEPEDESIWIEKYSETHKRKFWKNTLTGKSSWHDPKKPAPSSARTLAPVNSKKKIELPDIATSKAQPLSPGVQQDKPLLSASSASPAKPPPLPPRPVKSTAPPLKQQRQEEEEEQTSGSASATASAGSASHQSPKEQVAAAAAALEPAPTSKARQQNRFSGGVPLQWGLWGHYMSLGCSLLCFWFGIVAVLWDKQAHFYGCKVDGAWIHEDYIRKGPEFGVLTVSMPIIDLLRGWGGGGEAKGVCQ